MYMHIICLILKILSNDIVFYMLVATINIRMHAYAILAEFII